MFSANDSIKFIGSPYDWELKSFLFAVVTHDRADVLILEFEQNRQWVFFRGWRGGGGFVHCGDGVLFVLFCCCCCFLVWVFLCVVVVVGIFFFFLGGGGESLVVLLCFVSSCVVICLIKTGLHRCKEHAKYIKSEKSKGSCDQYTPYLRVWEVFVCFFFFFGGGGVVWGFFFGGGGCFCFLQPSPFNKSASLAKWLRRPPQERHIRGSIFACAADLSPG